METTAHYHELAEEIGETNGSARLRFLEPLLPALPDVLAEYRRSYASGVITNASLVERFEAAAAERLGVPHCVAVSSCTSGLMLVARSLGLKGRVIVPSFTFFATAHALAWNGLEPIFADCDPLTWNISPSDVERLITPDVSAILGVHMFGNPCDVEALQDIATRHSVKLIFDAAHAFGSSRHGRPVGGFGDAEVFSLSPTKILIAGEGGLVATHDSLLAGRLRAARNYGDTGIYDPEVIGLNARMSEFNGALALAGLPMVDQKVRRRNEIAGKYEAGLSDLPGISFQQVDPNDISTFKDYSVCIDPAVFPMDRDSVIRRLASLGIECKRYFYPPLHQQRLYRRWYDSARSPLSVTDQVSGRVLSLPIYETLPDATIHRIIAAIKNAGGDY